MAAQLQRWHRLPSKRASAHQPQANRANIKQTKKKPCASPTTCTCDLHCENRTTSSTQFPQAHSSSIPSNHSNCQETASIVCGPFLSTGSMLRFCTRQWRQFHHVGFVDVTPACLYYMWVFLKILRLVSLHGHCRSSSQTLSQAATNTKQTRPKRHPASLSLTIGILSSDALSHPLTTSSSRMWVTLPLRELSMMAEPEPSATDGWRLECSLQLFQLMASHPTVPNTI